MADAPAIATPEPLRAPSLAEAAETSAVPVSDTVPAPPDGPAGSPQTETPFAAPPAVAAVNP